VNSPKEQSPTSMFANVPENMVQCKIISWRASN
jgi:hypothetical protein